MIYKATKIKSVRHAGMMARHLLRADENEIVEVVEIRGTARPDDLTASLRSMQRATDLTRGKTGLFSVAINPRDHEADQMTPEQWQRSLQALEEEFKLTGQPCAIVRHRKNDRSHLHAVYQLTDIEAERLIDIKFEKRRCQKLGRQMELEFGHQLTPETPSRESYTRAEQQQAKRLGEKIPERRQQLRADLEGSQDLEAFIERLVEKGYTIAKGDRAGAVLINHQGEVFGLGRELGLKAAEVRKLLGEHMEQLPALEDEKNRLAVQKEKQELQPEPPAENRELSDSQDRAAALLEYYRKQQQERERKLREAVQQAKHQLEKEQQQNDRAAELLWKYHHQHQERGYENGLDFEL